jgi:hypothetical protein
MEKFIPFFLASLGISFGIFIPLVFLIIIIWVLFVRNKQRL